MTLKKALIAAAIFEMLGAIALGSHVAGTLKSGIALYSCFATEPNLYMIGMTSALGAAAAWLLLASVAGLPVSATHSIVGGIVGMSLALKGAGCVNWGMTGVGKIVLSWVTSPLLSSAAAFLVYTLVVRVVYFSSTSFERALWATPFLLATAVTFLAMLTFWDLAKVWWAKVLILVCCPIIIFSITVMFGIPFLRKSINTAFEKGELNSRRSAHTTGGESRASNSSSPLLPYNGTSHPSTQEDDEEEGDAQSVPMIPMDNDATKRLQQAQEYRQKQELSRGQQLQDRQNAEQSQSSTQSESDDADQQVELDLSHPSSKNRNGLEEEAEEVVEYEEEEPEQQKATQVFWYLQNVTACFGSFAHGANDTANTIGPFSAVFHLWMDGTFDPIERVPFWIVALGGASIVAGLAILGHRVIQTMGKDIIHLDYASGFSSELSSSMTVVIASRLQIPVSSTHCQVGSIVGVGLVEDHKKRRLRAAQQQQGGAPSSQPAAPAAPALSDPELAVNSAANEGGSIVTMTLKEEIMARLSHVHWKSVAKIAVSWLITVPFSAAAAAIFALILKQTMR